MHSTNYTRTFISVADDYSAEGGSVPPAKRNPTIARMQYEMICQSPYRYTCEDVIFAVHAARNGIAPADLQPQRAAYFSKGQACLRASALGKRYGWGIGHDAESRVALYPRDSSEYDRLSQDAALKQLKAMKSTR